VENTCITATYDALSSADFSFNQPFSLKLSDGQIFIAEEVIRLIPKRRMVVFGFWQGQAAAVKLFFDARAARHVEKDIAGIRALQTNKVPTPALLHQGYTEDKRVHVLIFERITDACNLEAIWQEKKSIEEVLPILKNVIIEIATQHVLGLLQHDLHLKNFLLTEKIIYTLDGAQIEVFPHLLTKQVSINNLVLLLSQLGVDAEEAQKELFLHYANARGWTVKPEDLLHLSLQIKKCNRARWQQYTKKIYRDSTHFMRIRKFSTFAMLNRHYAGAELLQFLSHPASAFISPQAVLLKKGNSATVIKMRLDNRDYVIKRYNLKNIWHRLRRACRQTRASASWRLANKLNLFGIANAAPVAFIENRVLGMRGVSYCVTEYISDEHAGDYFARHIHDAEKTQKMVKHITDLFKNLARLEMTHGDLKITNILINAEEFPVFIDLDGAMEHASKAGLQKAWQKELARFLENFNHNADLQEKFRASALV